MAPIVSAMQYFADKNRGTEKRTVILLGNFGFAQSLYPFEADGIAIESTDEIGDAVEHVPTYSRAVLQVPYNQQLGSA
jgi:hypothetical protein